jgi:hypothetical protein
MQDTLKFILFLTIFFKFKEKINFCILYSWLNKGHEVFAKAGYFRFKAERRTIASIAGLSCPKVR